VINANYTGADIFQKGKIPHLLKLALTVIREQNDMSERTHEEIYLTDMHNQSEKNAIDLHTYFYWKDIHVCPICNEWLIMRAKPELAP
jgi:hypothetical protein